MLMPSLFRENLFEDDFFDGLMNFPEEYDFNRNFFGKKNPLYGKHAASIMKTDVRDTENGYEVDVDLPGFKKEDISLSLKDGYLTISASKGLQKDEKDKKDKFIRQERYSGICTRSFYVGDAYANEDIKAKYEDGILRLSLPKKDHKQVEQNQYIAIEG